MFGVRSEDQEAKFAHDHMSSWANGVAELRAMKSCHRLNIGRREQPEMSSQHSSIARAILPLFRWRMFTTICSHLQRHRAT